MAILSLLVGLGSLVCWIMVLVKIFQAKQVWQGVVGIICPLFALIWGWMKAAELGTSKIMPIWTGLVVVQVILNVLFASRSASVMAPPAPEQTHTIVVTA